MPKNEAKLVKISIWSLSEGLSENQILEKVYFLQLFQEVPLVKIQFFTFCGS